MNIISRILQFLTRSLKTAKKTLPKPKQITLAHGDAAIVLRPHGIDFVYPQDGSTPPPELIDMIEYLHFAIQQERWYAEWIAEKELSEAVANLVRPNDTPRFKVLDGGLATQAKTVKGPFAEKDDE